jgi:hypothetical protein
MSDPSNVAKSLRERLGPGSEDRLGRALSELLENPLFTGAIGRAFDAREKASQAQEVAMGALNIPSAADIERLTRRLRAVSHRLEGIEDGVHRLDRALSPSGVEVRLSAIEERLTSLTDKLAATGSVPASTPARRPARRAAGRAGAGKATAGKRAAGKAGAGKRAAGKAAAGKAAAGKGASGKRAVGKAGAGKTAAVKAPARKGARKKA